MKAIFQFIVGLVAIAFLVSLCSSGEKGSSSGKKDSAEDRRKGFHCLSAWDGSHRDFKKQVKEVMRDPDSFEHISTRVTPEKNGEHTIIMEYRARNGFGGMNIGTALGTYSNATCKSVVLSVE